jgi:starch phosphorylase
MDAAFVISMVCLTRKIIDGHQVELPDAWLRKGFPWEVQRLDKAVNVRFGGNAYMEAEPDGSLKCIHEGYMNVRAVPYDVPILGYRNDTVNTLRLWKAEYTREDVFSAASLRRCASRCAL